MYVYGVVFQLITVLCICMYGLCPCACVAYDQIKVMLLFVVVSTLKSQRQYNFQIQPYFNVDV